MRLSRSRLGEEDAMVAQISIAPQGLGADELDLLARQLEGELEATGGVVFAAQPHQAAAGTRGDPASIAMGTLLLATITSGTVTALFNVLKSYVERGSDITFEGKDARGETVKVAMKNVGLSQFRDFLSDLDILK
jgi:hypothetical protein